MVGGVVDTFSDSIRLKKSFLSLRQDQCLVLIPLKSTICPTTPPTMLFSDAKFV
jgi:hypothetical protein